MTIAYYLFASVLLVTGQWAETPARPYETKEECEMVKAIAEMAMEADADVFSYNVQCQKREVTKPLPQAHHVPGKNEAEGSGPSGGIRPGA